MPLHCIVDIYFYTKCGLSRDLSRGLRQSNPGNPGLCLFKALKCNILEVVSFSDGFLEHKPINYKSPSCDPIS